MGLNLKKVKKAIGKVLEDQYNFKTEYTFEENNVKATCDLTLKGIDDGIFFKVQVYQGGALYIDFILDKLDINPDSLLLIEKFNENSICLRAYVSEGGYLTLSAGFPCVTEKNLGTNIDETLYHLSKDEIIELVAPLAELTYTAE